MTAAFGFMGLTLKCGVNDGPLRAEFCSSTFYLLHHRASNAQYAMTPLIGKILYKFGTGNRDIAAVKPRDYMYSKACSLTSTTYHVPLLRKLMARTKMLANAGRKVPLKFVLDVVKDSGSAYNWRAEGKHGASTPGPDRDVQDDVIRSQMCARYNICLDELLDLEHCIDTMPCLGFILDHPTLNAIIAIDNGLGNSAPFSGFDCTDAPAEGGTYVAPAKVVYGKAEICLMGQPLSRAQLSTLTPEVSLARLLREAGRPQMGTNPP